MSNPTRSELYCTASAELEAEVQKELEETEQGEDEIQAIEDNVCETTRKSD